MLILERIVSTNSPTEFIEARKEGRAIYPHSYNQDRQNLLGTQSVYTYPPSNYTLVILPSELIKKEPCRRCAISQLLLSTQVSGDTPSIYCSFGISKAFFNKTNTRCGFSTSNFDVILSSASIFLWIVPGMPCISTCAPSSERSDQGLGMLSLRMVRSH